MMAKVGSRRATIYRMEKNALDGMTGFPNQLQERKTSLVEVSAMTGINPQTANDDGRDPQYLLALHKYIQVAKIKGFTNNVAMFALSMMTSEEAAAFEEIEASEASSMSIDKVKGGAPKSTLPAKLYHYTQGENAASILKGGLQPGLESGKVFTTPMGAYSFTEAQMYLALKPNVGLPGAVLEIDTATLESLGIRPSAGPMRVLPTPNGMGGGTEVIFTDPIPPAAIRRVN